MKNTYTFLIAIALVALTVLPVFPVDAARRDVEGIAAIVNDEVVSIYDVEQRVNLFFASSGIPKTEENIKTLRNQVLRTLVDEKMQVQIALENDIEISQAEIDNQILRMAQQSGGDVDDIHAFLKENNIRPATLENQIRAEIAWQNFIQRKFSGRINISEAEIEETMERAINAINRTRYNLSEILLVGDMASDGARLSGLARQLIEELKKGVDFAAVARQFSNASSAATGGRVGWTTEDQLDPKLASVVTSLGRGEISAPIVTNAGIYIVKVDGIQQSGGIDPDRHIFDLLILSLTNDRPSLAADLRRIKAEFKTCKRLEQADQAYHGGTLKRTGPLPVGGYRPAVKNILLKLEAGEISAPIRNKDTTDLLIVCDRKDDQGVEVSRDQIENNIYRQRMSMISRRQLRELRRDAVVEYR